MADEDRGMEEVKRMKALEEEIIHTIEERTKLQKLEAQARSEIENATAPAVPSGSAERRLLLFAAAIIVFLMPFIYPVEGVLLAFFTIVIAVIAGLTAARRTPTFNVFIAAAGLIVFQLAAIYEYHAGTTTQSFLFWTDELLALIFLFATYFSVKTYRIHRSLAEERDALSSAERPLREEHRKKRNEEAAKRAEKGVMTSEGE